MPLPASESHEASETPGADMATLMMAPMYSGPLFAAVAGVTETWIRPRNPGGRWNWRTPAASASVVREVEASAHDPLLPTW